ncbi:MAG: hypothetical protein GX491_13020 [Chloroflexi bacterium]|nr:hypothetical protein [Chloroflexota bacterium]
MQKDRSFWPDWARFLHHYGLSDIAAALLEAAGPLNVFLAQAVYAGRPFFSRSGSVDHLDALADLFEDQEESRSFASYLREESSG